LVKRSFEHGLSEIIGVEQWGVEDFFSFSEHLLFDKREKVDNLIGQPDSVIDRFFLKSFVQNGDHFLYFLRKVVFAFGQLDSDEFILLFLLLDPLLPQDTQSAIDKTQVNAQCRVRESLDEFGVSAELAVFSKALYIVVGQLFGFIVADFQRLERVLGGLVEAVEFEGQIGGDDNDGVGEYFKAEDCVVGPVEEFDVYFLKLLVPVAHQLRVVSKDHQSDQLVVGQAVADTRSERYLVFLDRH
jgi:hypothetical protein